MHSSTDLNPRTLILGAGPAGLTAAYELMASGHSIVVLEQDPNYVGGLARTVCRNGFRFDIGGHRFFSKNRSIVQWWNERLPNDFILVKRVSRILYNGKYYAYPLKPIEALFNLGIITSTKCLWSFLKSTAFPVRPVKSFEDWVSNHFGSELFNIFFKTYTEKVWGMPCSQISADWARQRIKGLSLTTAVLTAVRRHTRSRDVAKTLQTEFRYPRLGPGMLWEKVRDDLLASGVRVAMGRKVIELIRSGDRIISVKTRNDSNTVEEWTADNIISSMPLRDLILNIQPGLKLRAQNAARALRYRDFVTVALIIKNDNLFPDNWLYVHDPTVKVGRIQNFNNWSLAMIPLPGITCLGLEYFCSIEDPFWKLSDDEMATLAKDETCKLRLCERHEIIDHYVVKMEKAYPVYDFDYKSNILAIREELESIANVQVVGRNGMHKYNNQDHSMFTGMLAARNLSGQVNDLWKVNTDAEYYEETVVRKHV